MLSSDNRCSPHELIEEACETYREALPAPNPDGPSDVRILLEELRAHLFEQDLRVKDVRQRCGLRNNTVSGDFGYHVGLSPKVYLLHHRIELAKHLLTTTDLLVGSVARGVGWGSPGAFSTTFKKHVGETPSAYRKRTQNKRK